MSRRAERLVKHREGEGRLHLCGNASVPVRCILDCWLEDISTGSGTRTEMQRLDGFVWWEGLPVGGSTGTLETDDGAGTPLACTTSDRTGLRSTASSPTFYSLCRMEHFHSDVLKRNGRRQGGASIRHEPFSVRCSRSSPLPSGLPEDRRSSRRCQKSAEIVW
jgi:hypothetical protein